MDIMRELETSGTLASTFNSTHALAPGVDTFAGGSIDRLGGTYLRDEAVKVGRLNSKGNSS